MNRTSARLLCVSLLFLSIITPHVAHGKFSFKTISSWFSNKLEEEIIEKAYDIEEGKKLSLENINGNITIKTDPQQVTVSLKATKRALEEELAYINVINEYNNDNLIIKTEVNQETIKDAVIDYELSVPANVKLHLITQNGSITVDNVHTPLVATTLNGNIDIEHTYASIKADSKETGNVHVIQAIGNVYVSTGNGGITIDNASKSVVAHAHKGNISVTCDEVPPTSTIRLNTNSGTIALALPPETNATLKGKTDRGTVISDHYITLKEQTTQLNRKAWVRFKKEVNGILGSGEADIQMHTASGNVKIKEVKIA